MNNMGAITKVEVEVFSIKVLAEEFPQWKMRWTKGGDICIRERKIIFIDEDVIHKYPWQTKERILHECAHINTTDKFHGVEFYKEYIRLLQKFILL